MDVAQLVFLLLVCLRFDLYLLSAVVVILTFLKSTMSPRARVSSPSSSQLIRDPLQNGPPALVRPGRSLPVDLTEVQPTGSSSSSSSSSSSDATHVESPFSRRDVGVSTGVPVFPISRMSDYSMKQRLRCSLVRLLRLSHGLCVRTCLLMTHNFSDAGGFGYLTAMCCGPVFPSCLFPSRVLGSETSSSSASGSFQDVMDANVHLSNLLSDALGRHQRLMEKYGLLLYKICQGEYEYRYFFGNSPDLDVLDVSLFTHTKDTWKSALSQFRGDSRSVAESPEYGSDSDVNWLISDLSSFLTERSLGVSKISNYPMSPLGLTGADPRGSAVAVGTDRVFDQAGSSAEVRPRDPGGAFATPDRSSRVLRRLNESGVPGWNTSDSDQGRENESNGKWVHFTVRCVDTEPLNPDAGCVSGRVYDVFSRALDQWSPAEELLLHELNSLVFCNFYCKKSESCIRYRLNDILNAVDLSEGESAVLEDLSFKWYADIDSSVFASKLVLSGEEP